MYSRFLVSRKSIDEYIEYPITVVLQTIVLNTFKYVFHKKYYVADRTTQFLSIQNIDHPNDESVLPTTNLVS